MQSNRNRDVSSAFFPENKLFLSVPMCHSIADDQGSLKLLFCLPMCLYLYVFNFWQVRRTLTSFTYICLPICLSTYLSLSLSVCVRLSIFLHLPDEANFALIPFIRCYSLSHTISIFTIWVYWKKVYLALISRKQFPIVIKWGNCKGYLIFDGNWIIGPEFLQPVWFHNLFEKTSFPFSFSLKFLKSVFWV